MQGRHSVSGLTAAVLVLSLSACGQTLTLPTVARANGWCREIGYDGVLRGDPDDPRVAWGEHQTRVNHVVLRKELVWPPGYTARFTPELEILDASHQIRFVAGDLIEGGCLGGSGHELYVIEE